MKTTFGGLVRNLLTSRAHWLRTLIDPRRDIDAECGHPQDILIADYVRAFTRGDLAKRIVSIYPEECWCENPEVFETEDEDETEFEKAWIALEKKHRLYSCLQRADMLSGIGRFGVLLLGIDDGLDLRQPAPGVGPEGEKTGNQEHTLLYVRPFDEGSVSVKDLETDTSNPRFGHPSLYEIQFADTASGTSKQVHWSRIIHIADNRTSSDVFGSPRMELVFDRLLDLKKITGGSGEMFWKGGFPGISLETAPGAEEEIDFDSETVKTQMDAYMNGLQRYIATVGMQAKSLVVQVADPAPHIEAQIRLIASAMGIPWRILMGVEVGQLAGAQDMIAWNRRIARRRNEYLTPFVISPTIDRLIAFGVLPELGEDSYQVEWKDLNTPSDEDKAIVADKRTSAMAKYVQSGLDVLMSPFHYLTLVLDFDDDEANAIIEEVGDSLIETDPDADDEREIAKADALAKIAAKNAPKRPPVAR